MHAYVIIIQIVEEIDIIHIIPSHIRWDLNMNESHFPLIMSLVMNNIYMTHIYARAQ